MNNQALIFTKKVLPISNTFVASQALSLPSIEPIFIGFQEDQAGLDLINGARTCIQKNHESYPRLSKFLLENFNYLSAGWKSALKSHQADIIHAHFGKGGFYSTGIAKSLGIPLIVTFHGSDITQKDKFSYNHKHRTQVFNKADKIIAASKFIQKKLVSNGCPEEKIVQLYTGINTEFFSPKEDKSSVPTILFVGRLIAQKGCAYLLDAMKIINQISPDTRLIIAGDGKERNNLEKKAVHLKNIQFVGSKNTSQVRDLMQKAWVMCAPSIVMKRGNEEGLGMVFLEAQAMGTPVVSFDTGGVREAVDNGKTGIVVPERDSRALSDALLNIINSEDIRNDFGKAGIERVEKYFNIKKQSEKLERIYYNEIN